MRISQQFHRLMLVTQSPLAAPGFLELPNPPLIATRMRIHLIAQIRLRHSDCISNRK